METLSARPGNFLIDRLQCEDEWCYDPALPNRLTLRLRLMNPNCHINYTTLHMTIGSRDNNFKNKDTGRTSASMHTYSLVYIDLLSVFFETPSAQPTQSPKIPYLLCPVHLSAEGKDRHLMNPLQRPRISHRRSIPIPSAIWTVRYTSRRPYGQIVPWNFKKHSTPRPRTPVWLWLRVANSPRGRRSSARRKPGNVLLSMQVCPPLLRPRRLLLPPPRVCPEYL